MDVHRIFVVAFAAASSVSAVAAPRAARAEVGVFVQGRGVAGADDSSELIPGAMRPVHGTGLGWRLGARVLFLEGFVSRTEFGEGSTSDNAVLGFADDLSLGNVRIRGSAGLGALRVRGGALGVAAGGDADGPLARVAVALDFDLGAGVWFGAELETTTYRIVPEGGSVIDDGEGGTVVLGALQLGLELGL
jgi:hypothetical protein